MMPAEQRSPGAVVFHVHAARDAYTAQRMTVTHYEGAVDATEAIEAIEAVEATEVVEPGATR